MKSVCLECKNELDLSAHSNLKQGDVVECQMCGITLQVMNIAEDGNVETEIVDEGK